MKNADFKALMERIARAYALTSALGDTHETISQNSADCLRVALEMLEEAAETMDNTL